MEEGQIALFLADFDHQVSQIENIYDLLENKTTVLTSKNIAPELVESSEYWLHNLFCTYEDLFKIVSAFWENDIRSDGAFHRTLISLKSFYYFCLREKNYRRKAGITN